MAAPDRLFVALPVPEHVRVLVTAARAPAEAVAPELAWSRPDGWHVTLAFIGEVADGDAVREAVAAGLRDGPIELALGDAGTFGGRVLWLRIHDDPQGAVARLGAAVQRSLVAADLPVQERRVRPHLTLARSARGRPVDETVVAAVAPVTARWEAAEVQLVRSVRGGGPARYEPVAAWSLTGTS